MAAPKATVGGQRSPIEVALAARDSAGVRAAIESGCDVNAPFADGLTALCRASALGERRIVKLLLSAGAEVDAVPKRLEDEESEISSTSVSDQVAAALRAQCPPASRRHA